MGGVLEHSNFRKERESNLELFRIIVMFLIVAHHYVVNSGLMDEGGPVLANPTSVNSIFLLIFGMWGKTGINCFLMITGYFMCKQSITVKKFAKLFLEWLFYKYLFIVIFLICGYGPYSLTSLVKIIIPIWRIDQGFVGCFMVFYLAIPFLNILLSNINRTLHVRLILLLGFIYVIMGTLHNVAFNYFSWFCVIYVIAAFIRLYPSDWMKNVMICGGGLLLSVALSVSSIFVSLKLGKEPFFFVTDSNTLLAVTTGLFAFLFFKNIRIPFSKVINTISASTFGILLIHANSDNMRQWLWRDFLDNVGHYGDKYMPLYAIVCVAGVFAICAMIDMIRIRAIEKPFFSMWERYYLNSK